MAPTHSVEGSRVVGVKKLGLTTLITKTTEQSEGQY